MLTILQNSQSQEGNSLPIMSNGLVDINSGEVTVTYSDEDGNLPIHKNIQLCDISDNCFYSTRNLQVSSKYRGCAIF